MTEEQTKWNGFTIVYYYPQTKKIVMSGTIPDEFSGKTTIENVRDFHLHDMSKVKFIDISPTVVRVVVKGRERFELEIMVMRMQGMHYDNERIVELR